ncbi:ferroxidase fet3, partial [Coemansia sp. RSA 1933]
MRTDPVSVMPENPHTKRAAPSPADRYPIGVINGVSGDKAPTLPFAANSTYRLRLLNIGSTSMFRFAIDDHDMYVIEADGVASEPLKVPSVVLGVAQRISVLVSARPNATVSSNSRYYAEIFTDVFPEAQGFNPRMYSGSISYSSEAALPAPKRPWAFSAYPFGFDDLDLIPFDRQPLLPAPDVSHDVVLSANRSGSDLKQAFINGISFELPRVPSIFTALGYMGDGAVNDASFGHSCNAKVLHHLDSVELVVANHDS